MIALNLTQLYADDFFLIRANKDLAILELTFRQHPDTEHFRNAYNLAFSAALSKDIKYWLTDAQQIKFMERENQQWLMAKMAPLLKSYTLTRFAIVMAPECFVMTNPNQVYEKPTNPSETQTPGVIKVHFDKEAAYSWLFNGQEVKLT